MRREDMTCKVCGRPIFGRSDKEYCSRKCNNDFNNDKRKDDEEILRPFINRYRNSYYALKSLYPESKGERYLPLTKAIQLRLELNSPDNKFKAQELPFELTRIANYGYRIDPDNHTIIIFKLK
jgi:hypothetical protein